MEQDLLEVKVQQRVAHSVSSSGDTERNIASESILAINWGFPLLVGDP